MRVKTREVIIVVAVFVGLLVGFAWISSLFAGDSEDAGVGPVMPAPPPRIEADISAFDLITFPDSLPEGITLAEEWYYDYDDMSVRYPAEILVPFAAQSRKGDVDVIARYLGEKFNMDITLSVASMDIANMLTSLVLGDDIPDVLPIPDRATGFDLSTQGNLWDARAIYPFMPQTCKYVTKGMIAWSTNRSTGEIPFFTKYPAERDMGGFAIRRDWLDKFGMTEPRTEEELLAYARACANAEPNGPGAHDTWFMTAAGNGNSWGQLESFAPLFGRPGPYKDADGELSYAMFNGTRAAYLRFLKQLNDAGVLVPDWFISDGEMDHLYLLSGRIGMTFASPVSLIGDYLNYRIAYGDQTDGDGALSTWTWWSEAPIKGGKYLSADIPGSLWAFSMRSVDSVGKMTRLAHLLDTLCIGGKNYFASIAGGSDEVFENAGLTLNTHLTGQYTLDGMYFLRSWRDENADSERRVRDSSADWSFLANWNALAYTSVWQQFTPGDDDPEVLKYAESVNGYNEIVSGYGRWPADYQYVSLSEEGNYNSANMSMWVIAEEYRFVTGSRDLAEWDDFAREWLERGGDRIISDYAESLGIPVPVYAILE